MPNQILARKEEFLDKKTTEKNNNFEEENFKKSNIQNSQKENIKTDVAMTIGPFISKVSKIPLNNF